MKLVIIDTETTGLYGKDEVIQFAAIITDMNFRIERVVNFYCDTVHPINPKAQEVHKLSFKDIHELSGGRTFEDQFLEFKESLNGEDLIWIEWSSSGFDMRMINQTLGKFGLEKYYFGKKTASLNKKSGIFNFNLMHAIGNMFYNGKFRKLEIACNELLPVSADKISKLYEKYIKSYNVATGAHHADYDAFLCYLLISRYGNKFV